MTPLRTYPVGYDATQHNLCARRRPGTYEPRTKLLLPRHALEQRARAEDVAQERRPVVEHDAVARGHAHDERLQDDAAHVAPVEERPRPPLGGAAARRAAASAASAAAAAAAAAAARAAAASVADFRSLLLASASSRFCSDASRCSAAARSSAARSSAAVSRARASQLSPPPLPR